MKIIYNFYKIFFSSLNKKRKVRKILKLQKLMLQEIYMFKEPKTNKE
jgi:hypothetical protein